MVVYIYNNWTYVVVMRAVRETRPSKNGHWSRRRRQQTRTWRGSHGGDHTSVVEASPCPVLYSTSTRWPLALRLQRRHVHHAYYGTYVRTCMFFPFRLEELCACIFQSYVIEYELLAT
jgi:hypothetical protein